MISKGIYHILPVGRGNKGFELVGTKTMSSPLFKEKTHTSSSHPVSRRYCKKVGKNAYSKAYTRVFRKKHNKICVQTN